MFISDIFMSQDNNNSPKSSINSKSINTLKYHENFYFYALLRKKYLNSIHYILKIKIIRK